MTSASGPVLIGVDIGTTNLKVVAIRPDGAPLNVVRRGMRIDHPGPGAAEFDLGQLEGDLVALLGETVERLAVAGHGPADIAAIGICSIGESFVGLDEAGRRVTPCPTWFDRRTANLRAEWGLTPRDWFDRTGMVDDDIYTVHRLGHARRTGAGWFGRARRWAMVADYAVWCLTGTLAANPSLAARSGLADRRTGAWDADLVRTTGLDAAALPDLRPQGEGRGALTAAIAALTGLAAGTPVVNAGHDHPCAGLACRMTEPGPVIDSTGTSEALKTVVDRPLGYDEVGGGLYDCYPYVIPGRFILSGHIPASGALLDWLERLLAGPDGGRPAIDRLWQAAEQAPAGTGGVRVLPYLRGTGAPWNQRGRRAEIVGLGEEASAGTVLRAAVEGLSSWLLLNLDRFAAITGERPDELILAGGGARNAFVDAVKAALIDRPLVMPDVEEAAGIGAALVGGLAVGLFASPAEAVRLEAIGSTRIDVDPALAAVYAPLVPDLVGRLTSIGEP
ncbi:Apulose kinase [Pleomorphomonas sp. T1.2MG-36]|uniref:FGGY-family carbohydrate kinase n=1 Tax=Pleomorphomonas sp. T1.2MG-36 TaxID=3041167 RepID=UPI0024773902|nr:FGGY-family carbohydrate kinase [Pleomorphomonas sp. T1.2MG-36]CAI9416596.1 Apulose kinase [Pleomorphomonas sp. T1.2MG-36]